MNTRTYNVPEFVRIVILAHLGDKWTISPETLDQLVRYLSANIKETGYNFVTPDNEYHVTRYILMYVQAQSEAIRGAAKAHDEQVKAKPSRPEVKRRTATGRGV